MLNMGPQIASEFVSQKWKNLISGYQVIESMCKLKSSGIKKMFKELPILECKNEVTKATNYLILALTAYKATAEVIFDRLLNVTVVCQIIKPWVSMEKGEKFSWNHQAIFTLIRSAANIFLVQLLGEFYDMKSNCWKMKRT